MSSEATSHALNVLKSQLQQLEEELSEEREHTTRTKVCGVCVCVCVGGCMVGDYCMWRVLCGYIT